MAVPDPTQVAPWYLRNINQALALEEATGNVYIRTGIEGDIIISGNVNIPGQVTVVSNEADPLYTHTHIYTPNDQEVSNTNPFSVQVISGNITVDTITGNVNVTQGTDPWIVAGNVNANVTNQATDLTIADSTYEMNIARGLIPGTTSVFKTGYNPSIANNSEESLWGQSTLYPWSAWNTGGTLSCVSASAGDTGTMEITGLRSADWVQITETVTLTGTTPVVTSNSFIRINNLHYNGPDTNVGIITVTRNATIVGAILAEFGQTQMAQYTVPAGYTAYLTNGNANMGKGNDGVGKFKYRPYGRSFQTAMTFLLFQSTFDYQFLVPLALPEKTDLDVTMLASNSGTACTCQYGLLLIQNT